MADETHNPAIVPDSTKESTPVKEYTSVKEEVTKESAQKELDKAQEAYDKAHAEVVKAQDAVSAAKAKLASLQ